jgi:hypothetical protein
VAALGRQALAQDLFAGPQTLLIDGRGAIWPAFASTPAGLWSYTLGHQVTQPYDFTAAIRTAAQELMPDVFIVLGPGTTLGGAVAQSLIGCNWRGWQDKAGFQAAQQVQPRLLSMGRDDQRGRVTGSV